MLRRHPKTLRRLWLSAAPLTLMDVSETAMAKNKKYKKQVNATVREKLVLEQAGVFPAKILGHCDQLGESILAKSTV